jgi:hypothetical protein
MTMWTRLLFLCSFAAAIQSAASAQTNDPLLQRVRGNVVDTVGRLPKYLCTLTVDRARYAADPVHASSCDGLAGQQSKGRSKPRLAETDRLRLDVAIVARNEIYSWVGEDRFEDRDLFLDLVRQGALQTGGYSIFLDSIFGSDAASFSSNGETELDGRTLAQFGFQVPREKSKYVFGNRRERFTTGYDGSVLADPKTGDLVRLVIRTTQLPADSGSCQATTTLDYSRVRLNGSDFLLPREAQLDILNTDGSELRNRTAYASCHEFRGESAIKFDAPAPDPNGAAASNSPSAKTAASALVLPAGLKFSLIFQRPIDTAAAAAGDRIEATLKTAIRDASAKAVLVPEGAEVTARIVLLEHFPGPPSSIRMQVKLEAVNVGGTRVPLRARMAQPWMDVRDQTPGELRPPGSSTMGAPPPGRQLQQRMQLGSLSSDPSVALFEFRDVKPDFVIKGGLESKWVTAP